MTKDEKLKDIKTNPNKHKHNFDSLFVCAFVDGAIDLSIIEAHKGLLGHNGGVPCDVRNGPCSCGAWH